MKIDKVVLGDELNHQDEIKIEITDGWDTEAETTLDRQDAIRFIDHLISVFDLKPATKHTFE